MLFQRTQLYSIQPPIIPTPRNQTPSSDLCGTYSCSDIQSLSVCLSRSPCCICLPIHTDIHIVCTYRQPGLGPWLGRGQSGLSSGPSRSQGQAEVWKAGKSDFGGADAAATQKEAEQKGTEAVSFLCPSCTCVHGIGSQKCPAFLAELIPPRRNRFGDW